MFRTTRTMEQFYRHTAEQLVLAQTYGIQRDTPQYIACMVCANPQDLMSHSYFSRKTKRVKKAASISLNDVVTRELCRFEKALEDEAMFIMNKIPPANPPEHIQSPEGCIRVPQTLGPDLSCCTMFSTCFIQGVSQTACNNMDGIDGYDDPFRVFLEDDEISAIAIICVIAWPGYQPYSFLLDLCRQDESTRLRSKRPVCLGELASDILLNFTHWVEFEAMPLEAGGEFEHGIPRGWRVHGASPDIEVRSVWLTKFGPVVGSNGNVWVPEFIISPQV